jgi:hypothetical protein
MPSHQFVALDYFSCSHYREREYLFFNALVMPNHQFVALDYFSCASYLAIVVHPAISRKEEDSRNLLKWHTKRTLADHGRGCSCWWACPRTAWRSRRNFFLFFSFLINIWEIIRSIVFLKSGYFSYISPSTWLINESRLHDVTHMNTSIRSVSSHFLVSKMNCTILNFEWRDSNMSYTTHSDVTHFGSILLIIYHFVITKNK